MRPCNQFSTSFNASALELNNGFPGRLYHNRKSSKDFAASLGTLLAASVV